MADLVTQRLLLPGVVVLELNDPDSRNAMSDAMADEFLSRTVSLAQDASLRAVILTGIGSAFSGGGHLDMLFEKTKLDRDENRDLMESFYTRFLSIRSIPVPVIAAINGHAVGAGLCLALGCDIRIAVTEAKLGMNFVLLGLHPGMGATYFLPRLVGVARANELLFAGKIISATEAEKIGLVNHVVAADKLWPTVTELAESIASAGPIAIRQLKASLVHSEGSNLAECLKREADCQAENYAGAEFMEGISAARDKRKAKFVSR